MANFGKIYESSWWGEGVCANTVGWGSSYKSIANCSDASFSYAEASYAKNGTDPTPTITGDAGGTFTATPAGLSINSSTGEVTLSTSTINSYTVKYTLSDGTFTTQTLGITAASFSSTKSMAYDGVDDEITLGSLEVNTDEAWSVSFWANLDSFSSATYPGVFKLKTDESSGFCCFFSDTGSYKGINFGANSFENIKTDGDISASLVGAWNNIILTYNGSGKTTLGNYSIYVNGSPVTAVASGAYGSVTNVSLIGDVTQRFNGNVDEFAVFQGTELTSGNATSIYNSGSPNNLDDLSTPPTAWYRMGENGSWKSPQWLLPENSNKDKISNYSFNFDGIDNEFSFGDIPFLRNGGSYFSISAWVLTTHITQAGYWKCRSATPDQMLLIRDTNRRCRFSIKSSTGGNIYVVSDGFDTIPTNTWTHIVATFDGTQSTATDKLKLYINGAYVSQTVTGSGTNLPQGSLTIVNEIGSTPLLNTGKINNVAIWDSTLTAANATTLYNSGTPVDILTLSPTTGWKLGEDATFSTNWTVPDAVGSFDATSANMTVEDRVGDAPNSSNNSVSYNMDEVDRETDVPS